MRSQRVRHEWTNLACTHSKVMKSQELGYLFKISIQSWRIHSLCCCCLVAKSCSTLCDLMDYSPPDSSVHGIPNTWILELVAISSSRRSSWPRDQTCISCIGRPILYQWATRKIPVYLSPIVVKFYLESLQGWESWMHIRRAFKYPIAIPSTDVKINILRTLILK